jgi:hypothetical protein
VVAAGVGAAGIHPVGEGGWENGTAGQRKTEMKSGIKRRVAVLWKQRWAPCQGAPHHYTNVQQRTLPNGHVHSTKECLDQKLSVI